MRYVILALALLAHTALADQHFYGPYLAQYVRTIDGDTVEMLLHIYPGQTVSTRIRERTVDTPELRSRSKCEKLLAKEAKQFTQNVLESAEFVMVTEVTQGSFAGRMVGKIMVDTSELGVLLKSAHLAVPYSERGKAWCRDA